MLQKSIHLFAFLLLSLGTSAQTFTLKSADVGGQASMREVFNGFGCTGENVSPQLSWENAPEGTKSFAVTMYDPDAPTGSGWWHWLVFDIPADATELVTGAGSKDGKLLPAGAIQVNTDYGVPGYGGPCPPEGHGLHTYIVTVYALPTEKLGLDASAGAAVVGYYLNGQALGKASVVMYYGR
ncbi:MAG: YbhB/YbcL family Raf kinase inhibitor-like protein [Bacteroidota bacterium]